MDHVKLPQKKYFRQRAHCNPMSDDNFDVPIRPSEWNFKSLFNINMNNIEDQKIKILDVGCGFGGLLFNLSPIYPQKLIIGFEIRRKVSEYVKQKILSLKNEGFGNLACVRTNAMKYLVNYFSNGQLDKMFILFPDPHFKKSKHKWRFVNSSTIDEIAFVMAIGGIVYTITDVEELHVWMDDIFSSHKLFRKLSEEELASDEAYPLIFNSSEEAKKVTANNGKKFPAVFVRVEFCK